MALTEAQIDTVFEIIDLPRSTSVEQPTGDMGVSGQTFLESNVDFQLQTKIETRLANLTASSQTKLIVMVDRWEDIGTQSWGLDGGTQGIDGFSYAPQTEGAEIQRRVKRLIGVYQILDEVKNTAVTKGPNIIPVIN
jgi:hypothetical protein